MSPRNNSDVHTSDTVIKKRARVIIFQWVAIGILILYLVTSQALLGWNAFVGAQVRSQLVDCVKIGGVCFKEGQERQEGAIKALIENNELTEIETRRIILASIACDKIEGVDTLFEAEMCVKEQLAQDKAEREANK